MLNKQNLVVVGNGMAGARTVEEILARGGGEQFNITIFGDEPYGNYNRILLSNVLNGSQNESEIYLNPLEWYVENDIKLHCGVMADSILRRSRIVLGCDGTSEPYDKLIISTGSRSYIPPIEGLTLPDGSYKPGIFVFRTIDDCREIAEYARGRGPAAVIGGGLWFRSGQRAAKVRHPCRCDSSRPVFDGAAIGRAIRRHYENQH